MSEILFENNNATIKKVIKEDEKRAVRNMYILTCLTKTVILKPPFLLKNLKRKSRKPIINNN